MSRLTNILKKPEEVEFRGEKFVLHGLTGKNIDLFMEEEKNMSPEQVKEKMFNILFHTLKPGIEDLTIEEIKAMDMEAINFFMQKIQLLNNLEVPKKKMNLIKQEIENAKARNNKPAEKPNLREEQKSN